MQLGKTFAVLAALAVGGAAGYALRGLGIRPVTIASQSPSGKWRVLLVERPSGIDRNFSVEIEETGAPGKRTLFASPDEGKRGFERFVWSEDGTRVLLVGKTFFVVDGAALPNGEQLYFMADLTDNRIWCNATQRTQHPRFGLKEIQGTRWLGWTPPAG